MEPGRVCGVGPVRVVVDCGVKGDEEEGVMRELREVLMGSSMRARDVRRKERSADGEKQKVGVRCGGRVGADIMGRGGGRTGVAGGVARGGEEGEEGDAQNHIYALSVVRGGRRGVVWWRRDSGWPRMSASHAALSGAVLLLWSRAVQLVFDGGADAERCLSTLTAILSQQKRSEVQAAMCKLA